MFENSTPKCRKRIAKCKVTHTCRQLCLRVLLPRDTTLQILPWSSHRPLWQISTRILEMPPQTSLRLSRCPPQTSLCLSRCPPQTSLRLSQTSLRLFRCPPWTSVADLCVVRHRPFCVCYDVQGPEMLHRILHHCIFCPLHNSFHVFTFPRNGTCNISKNCIQDVVFSIFVGARSASHPYAPLPFS